MQTQSSLNPTVYAATGCTLRRAASYYYRDGATLYVAQSKQALRDLLAKHNVAPAQPI